MVQRVNQFPRAVEVVHLAGLGTQNADKLFLLDNESFSAPFAGEVNTTTLCQLSSIVKDGP